MNEQIKKLVIEAFFDESTNVFSNQMYNLGEEKMQKFGELIIEECCKYLKTEAERLYALQHEDGDLLAEKCYDNIEGIKDYFGIKNEQTN